MVFSARLSIFLIKTKPRAAARGFVERVSEEFNSVAGNDRAAEAVVQAEAEDIQFLQ